MKIRSILCASVVLSIPALSASADLVPNAITGVTAVASSTGDGNSDGSGSGGTHAAVDGSGLTVGSIADPTTWTHDTAWEDGWQSGNSGTTGQFILNLGSNYSNLDKLYLWNVQEGTHSARGIQQFTIYASNNPTVAPTMGSPYSFVSGGWTAVTTDSNVRQGTESGADTYSAAYSLAGVTAQYIGLDLTQNWGDGIRIGLAEAEITTSPTPEPASLGLLGAGALGLLARRRRA